MKNEGGPLVSELVSVIIPAFNVGRYIGQAIESVLNQTYKNVELLIIDDGSSDDTAFVVESYGDKRIKLLRNEENKGPSYSRNRGIAEAAGAWVAILDADDWWAEKRLETLIELAARSKANIVSDNILLIYDGAKTSHANYLKSRESIIGKKDAEFQVSPIQMIREDYGYLQPVIRTSLIREKDLLYSDKLLHGEDFRFLLECIIAGGEMSVTSEALYYYRIRPASLTSSDHREHALRSQLRSIAELLLKYGEDQGMREALRRYQRKKSIQLSEYLINQRVREKKFLSIPALLISCPLVIVPLTRKVVTKLR